MIFISDNVFLPYHSLLLAISRSWVMALKLLTYVLPDLVVETLCMFVFSVAVRTDSSCSSV
jgi:hypothetical protein